MTRRRLNYWVERGLIVPAKVYVPQQSLSRAGGITTGRRDFLFGFSELVQIQLVKCLRDLGVSLQRIKVAVEMLREREGADWHKAWLLTDGQDVFVRDDGRLSALTGPNTGQFALAVVPLERVVRRVRETLPTYKNQRFRFDGRRYHGQLLEYRDVG